MSCELETEPQSTTHIAPANHIVINEFFSLTGSNAGSYCWIEFLNPTLQPIAMRGYSLGFTTIRSILVQDTSGNFIGASSDEGYYEIKLQRNDSVIVPPNGFLTVVSNEARLETFMDYGPANGPKIEVGDVLSLPPDTAGVDSIVSVSFQFRFNPSDQVVLKDTAGNIVDVVRYGNYQYTGPETDPLLSQSNRSIGVIPNYQSIARFAGGYFTGNTANDFYITAQAPYIQTRPIPHYYSQAVHP